MIVDQNQDVDKNQDVAAGLIDAVRDAAASQTAVQIIGGDTKAFYGRAPAGRALNTAEHAGIVHYDPTELVVTARAGTLLTELESTLRDAGQMLPFEPPHFGAAATIGGTIACGLSGPRRPYTGSARDFVLGVRCITGRGEHLRFGGEVMKNVAGYDVARLMVGALGTLGVLTEVSLKVLPRNEAERTLSFDSDPVEAIRTMNELAGRSLPLSAACWMDERLYLRLSGTEVGVAAAHAALGGDTDTAGAALWRRLCEHDLPWFSTAEMLWRLSVAPAAAQPELPGDWLIDWGGAQRWVVTGAAAHQVRAAAQACGGHATLFRGGDRHGDVFQPLPEGLAALHRNLKQAFDPAGILNPGRLYADL